MDFPCLYEHGFARVAACTQRTAIADPRANADAILRQARELHDEGVAVAVFPELTLTGYSIEDLLLQDAVLDGVDATIAELVAQTADLLPVIVVGAPLRHRNRVYNCAVVVHRGRALGVVPKSYPPTYREFYEGRQLAHGDLERGGTIRIGDDEVPFGVDLLFAADDVDGLVVHVEICEDMWIPIPPSAEAALAGATVLLNLSGSPITVGRARDRKLLCQSASSRCLAAYVYSAAGQGESTTDLSWDGQTLIYENGVLLAETERFPDDDRRSVADVDLDLLRQERFRMGTFDDNRRTHHDRLAFRRVGFTLDPPTGDLGLNRGIERFPFVPADADKLDLDCYEAYNIQVAGLQQRLEAIGEPKIVIGVSGGLDSTHALIVAANAMDRAGRPRSDILGFTLPGFATSSGTKTNAHRLMEALGITATELDITETAELMLKNLEHPYSRGEEVYDVTFENVQAGLRTDYLFRIANQRGGIVLGTGDLSELALGWATYGVGDQMSHYNVNAGIPKTFIQHLIRWVIKTEQVGEGDVNETLQAIVDTEISPELVPGDELQSTESKIGPYALHDFTLFYTLRHGFRPTKIGFLAWHAWRDADEGDWPPNFPEEKRLAYDQDEIRKWLEVFCERFFAFAQFKRSALPNGPKVSAGGSLSPRGDWRAPSDSSAEVWLRDLERWR
jgi:NAD+ synthase (glutamine-hydrolysing)